MAQHLELQRHRNRDGILEARSVVVTDNLLDDQPGDFASGVTWDHKQCKGTAGWIPHNDHTGADLEPFMRLWTCITDESEVLPRRATESKPPAKVAHPGPPTKFHHCCEDQRASLSWGSSRMRAGIGPDCLNKRPPTWPPPPHSAGGKKTDRNGRHVLARRAQGTQKQEAHGPPLARTTLIFMDNGPDRPQPPQQVCISRSSRLAALLELPPSNRWAPGGKGLGFATPV